MFKWFRKKDALDIIIRSQQAEIRYLQEALFDCSVRLSNYKKYLLIAQQAGNSPLFTKN